MFENITKFMKKFSKKSNNNSSSKDTAKERLHLVLMQDRANVSADFLDLMRQEIIDVIKKYIEVDESAIDVRLTNKENEDGTNGAPALYANIPIINIKEEARQEEGKIAKVKDSDVAMQNGNKVQKQSNQDLKNEDNSEKINQASKIVKDNSKKEDNINKNEKKKEHKTKKEDKKQDSSSKQNQE